MNVVETLTRYWPVFLITFAVVVALCIYLGTESENRAHRRMKRAIRKYGVTIGFAATDIRRLGMG